MLPYSTLMTAASVLSCLLTKYLSGFLAASEPALACW